MKTIRGAQIDRFPLSHLKRVRDLESFDGPLISEYISPRGDRYLYYWCDCDSKVNRWMVLRVSGTDILRLAARFIPLDRVIPNGCRDDFVYFVDFDSERIPTNITLTPIDLIPAEYVPAEGAYLSEGVSENPTTFSVILSSNFSLGKLSELPRILSQAYGMMYALDVLKPAKLASYPWRGGFSAMHFYKWILDSLLPAEAKPGIRQWQYASPGFIEFEMDRSVATKVAEIAHDAIGSRSLRDAHAMLYAYIHDNNLNKMGKNSTTLAGHDAQLAKMTVSLLTSLQIANPDDFLQAAPRPFEAAKIALSFTRRLRSLSRYESDGLIKLPTD